MKVLLTLVVLAVLVLVVMTMVRSWQHRSGYRRAVMLAPFPRPPAELAGPDGAALLPAAIGVYAGTSMATGMTKSCSATSGFRPAPPCTSPAPAC
jgi:hypothetical protein